MFQILIIILIVILLVLAGIIWYQYRILKEIRGLMIGQQKLMDKGLDKSFTQVEQLRLSGDAKKEFDSLHEEYTKKVLPELEKIATTGAELQREARTTKLLTIKTDVANLSASLATVTSQISKITKSLQQLQRQGKVHRHAINTIKEKYQKFHQQLSEKNFEYGDSIQLLNKKLATLEEQYDKFIKLTNAGDQEAAQEILTDLQEANERLAKEIEQVPKLYRPLVTTYPDQLAELASGYQTLKKQFYVFPEDNIDQQIKQLKGKLEATVKQLNDLHLETVEHANQEMSEEIDHLYDVMQKEIDAKNEALHLMQVMGQFTQHAQQQNNELIAELDRLSLNYTLNNHELETARELNEQIKAITKEVNQDQQAIEDHTAIYSQILKREKANQQDLTNIEKSQEKVNDEVAKLQTDEQRAKQMQQRYAVQIRTIHRQVERLNLPGVAQDYLDDFFEVSDEIKKLAEELNEYKINMDDVTKQLIIVEADLETLQDKTKDLRDSAELTERLQQYANRFSGNKKVEAAAKKSQDLFKQYNYTGSLEVIAAALEEVEPGSFKRIEDAYYHEIGEA